MTAKLTKDEIIAQGKDTHGFEVVACSRCGGDGHYSYCPQYGTRCFKCSGRGYVYTARGAAALEFFRDSRKVAVVDLTVGDRVYQEPSPWSGGKWVTVTALNVKPRAYGDKDGIEMITDGEGLTCEPSYRVTRAEGTEVFEQRLAVALAYQETLTKKGTPRKR